MWSNFFLNWCNNPKIIKIKNASYENFLKNCQEDLSEDEISKYKIAFNNLWNDYFSNIIKTTANNMDEYELDTYMNIFNEALESGIINIEKYMSQEDGLTNSSKSLKF